MTENESLRTATSSAPAPTAVESRSRASTGVTIFGCGDDEAAVLRRVAHHHGLRLTVTDEVLSERNALLAFGNRCVSVGHKAPVPNPALLALSRIGVRYVSTRSVGLDHIDVEYAASVGVTVGNVVYSPGSVADYTLMLVLMSLRDAKSVVRRTDAHDYRLGDVHGRELRDLTVGVIGTGRTGSAVVDRLAGFGCRVMTFDARGATARPTDGLDGLLRQADVVTLHIPLSTKTRHLLDRHRISRMKRGSIIVNTARGGLVDTEAMVAALDSGHLGGVALDVIEGEDGIFYADCSGRPVRNPALLRLQEAPNAIISPHRAYFTDRALHDIAEKSLLDCLEFEGRRPA
ncbi:NAD(P)-dependent oxidoreductase [Tsukamurella sp. 8F]|uniref:NAD(P)-dependent oxidoreductase n=1 Tax=unclassified Tsukamurella TaxID=2633480 RepID=UPI0023B97A35|nr:MULTISPECIES: NAD(P)-dependent oxidoreductase [unclassified Tsukamurella]MDF0530947.1 NAD(P)-dependent oxidoreductase [Tsukamurella sp. 8J]MDF0588272.1 NAD(P)-dependent oxidoreductase [Tsukamurella sp. 8F]